MEPTDANRRMFDETRRRRVVSGATLPPIVRQTLGDLAKKSVLHLHCGSGQGSAELAELGATVTAIEPDEALLDKARDRWPSILWIAADAQSLPANLRRGRFDLVYSPEGVIERLADLDAWANGVASALDTHGELLAFDDHPVADCIDDFLRWRNDYFRDPADPDRLWRIGQVVSALVRAGLHIEALEEYPGGTARRRHDRRIPATFLLYARRA